MGNRTEFRIPSSLLTIVTNYLLPAVRPGFCALPPLFHLPTPFISNPTIFAYTFSSSFFSWPGANKLVARLSCKGSISKDVKGWTFENLSIQTC